MEGPSRVIKRRWRETIQSLYDDHVAPERDQQLKQSKSEIESKLPKILKLAKDKRNNRKNRNNNNNTNSEGNSKKDSELVEFIHDFQKQYQVIYDLYDSVRGQLTHTYNSINREDGYFTATSSSDSESDSSASLATDAPTLLNGNLRSVTHELEATSQQVADLKQQVTVLINEKEALNTEYLAALSKLEGTETFFQQLKDEHEELKERLNEKEREVLSLAEMQKKSQGETSALIKDLDGRVKTEAMTVKRLQTQNSELHAQIQTLLEKKISKKREKDPTTSPVDSENNYNSSETTTRESLLVGVNNQLNSLNSPRTHNSYKASLLSGGRQLQVDDQVNSLVRELESMRKQNSDLESQIKIKNQESSGYLMQIENLRKDSGIKAADYDLTLTEQKERAAAQIRDLELQIQTLLKEKTELEEQMESKDRENGQLTHELDGLKGKTSMLEVTLREREDQFVSLQKRLEEGEDDKSAEVTSLTTQINQLSGEKESLQERKSQLEKKLEDREDDYSVLENQMSSKISALGSEVNLLQKELDVKCKLDKKIRSQDSEISQLKEEKESLRGKIKELKSSLTEKEDVISALRTEPQGKENETFRQINALQKEEESGAADEKKGQQERLTEMENENMELRSTVEDQEAILKQQKETINRLNEDCKKVKGRFLQAADRKMDELAEEFRKNFEDKLRILSQRIRVAEQLHTENKERYKQMKEYCEQEHSEVDKKLSQYSGLLSSSKTELNKVLDATNEMLAGLEALIIRKFGNEEGNFMQRLSKISDELQITKDWVRWTINEIGPPGGRITEGGIGGSQIVTTTDEKEQEDKVTVKRARELEAKLNVEKGDKMKLMKGMYELQKRAAELERALQEKDEGLVKLGEEKVEAIRQLCIGIDYHRTRFDILKQMVMMNRRTRSR